MLDAAVNLIVAVADRAGSSVEGDAFRSAFLGCNVCTGLIGVADGVLQFVSSIPPPAIHNSNAVEILMSAYEDLQFVIFWLDSLLRVCYSSSGPDGGSSKATLEQFGVTHRGVDIVARAVTAVSSRSGFRPLCRAGTHQTTEVARMERLRSAIIRVGFDALSLLLAASPACCDALLALSSSEDTHGWLTVEVSQQLFGNCTPNGVKRWVARAHAARVARALVTSDPGAPTGSARGVVAAFCRALIADGNGVPDGACQV